MIATEALIAIISASVVRVFMNSVLAAAYSK
jgi:hypothetical protein